jgi:photosynthetic reaction center cytochrome c subunit
MKLIWRRPITAAAAIILAGFTGMLYARSQVAQPARPQMAEEAFKDIRVLKGIPVEEFMDTMGMFSASLGFCCTDCHVKDAVGNIGAFATPTPRILTARRMVNLVNTINTASFGGEKRVSCFTCHRGNSVPDAAPDLRLQYGEPPEPDPDSIAVARSTESPKPLFDKYIQAIGGTQRLASLTSFVATGTYTGYETGLGPVKLEIYAKAPNQRTTILKMPGEDSNRVYDGSNGWLAGPERTTPLTTLTGPSLFGARLEAITPFPTGIQQEFTGWRSGTVTIDGTEYGVAQGLKTGQLPVNFYFDQSTGLLKRIVRWNQTAVGPVPIQTDYDDYRDISGIKMPFNIVITWTDGRSTIELEEVRLNVAIEASRFAKPAPARPRR